MQKQNQVILTIGEIIKQRSHFHLAPDAVYSEELSLRGKQAVVDAIFHGRPPRELEIHLKRRSDGSFDYLVTKGWPQLCAILDFVDNKFPTWDDEAKRKWEQNQEE